tara:strand:+ start:163765 stop:164865 length:1101 start_codon:yes stop_codon:yes gene_type:complete
MKLLTAYLLFLLPLSASAFLCEGKHIYLDLKKDNVTQQIKDLEKKCKSNREEFLQDLEAVGGLYSTSDSQAKQINDYLLFAAGSEAAKSFNLRRELQSAPKGVIKAHVRDLAEIAPDFLLIKLHLLGEKEKRNAFNDLMHFNVGQDRERILMTIIEYFSGYSLLGKLALNEGVNFENSQGQRYICKKVDTFKRHQQDVLEFGSAWSSYEELTKEAQEEVNNFFNNIEDLISDSIVICDEKSLNTIRKELLNPSAWNLKQYYPEEETQKVEEITQFSTENLKTVKFLDTSYLITTSLDETCSLDNQFKIELEEKLKNHFQRAYNHFGKRPDITFTEGTIVDECMVTFEYTLEESPNAITLSEYISSL